jgi:hypothetical protein
MGSDEINHTVKVIERKVGDDEVGMNCELINLYQKKNKDDPSVWHWGHGIPDDITAAAENDETAKYALLVRNKRSFDSRKSLEIDSIIVQSPLIKQALGTVLKNYPGITTNLKRLEFEPPFRPFVYRWNQLVEVLAGIQDTTAKAHFQLLHDILHAELKDAIAIKNDLVANGVITFKYLWTILEPGSLIYSVDEGEERLYELSSISEGYDSDRGLPYMQLLCSIVDWNGEKFGLRNEYLSIYGFEGTEKISRLTSYPLVFHGDQEKLLKKLVLRGQQFERYAGYHYKAYEGIALASGGCGFVKHNVSDISPITICDLKANISNRWIPASSSIVLHTIVPCPIRRCVSPHSRELMPKPTTPEQKKPGMTLSSLMDTTHIRVMTTTSPSSAWEIKFLHVLSLPSDGV